MLKGQRGWKRTPKVPMIVSGCHITATLAPIVPMGQGLVFNWVPKLRVWSLGNKFSETTETLNSPQRNCRQVPTEAMREREKKDLRQLSQRGCRKLAVTLQVFLQGLYSFSIQGCTYSWKHS